MIELYLARGFVARSSSVYKQINFLSLTGKGIDAELNGFKFGLRASVHRAEWNSAGHHTPPKDLSTVILSNPRSKTTHLPYLESSVTHEARCGLSESRGWPSI